MIKGSIDSIESMGLADGPGIRCVVFMNGCKLKCSYCHNPEMWKMGKKQETPQELYQRIKRFIPYFGENGGVTFSGGEPLLQSEFLIEVCKLLKNDNIHIALDTAGVGLGNYQQLLEYIDLVIMDIKHVEEQAYFNLTGYSIEDSLVFLKEVEKAKKPLWIRQVIVPGIHDNKEYIDKLRNFLKKIKYIEKVEFLPFHRLGREKYQVLKIPYPLENIMDMDDEKTEQLYQYLIKG